MKNLILVTLLLLCIYSVKAQTDSKKIISPERPVVFEPNGWVLSDTDTIYYFWFSKKMLNHLMNDGKKVHLFINGMEFTMASQSPQYKPGWDDTRLIYIWRRDKNNLRIKIEKIESRPNPDKMAGAKIL
jgi:hypothetical protein